jgi:hypothetical protein
VPVILLNLYLNRDHLLFPSDDEQGTAVGTARPPWILVPTDDRRLAANGVR